MKSKIIGNKIIRNSKIVRSSKVVFCTLLVSMLIFSCFPEGEGSESQEQVAENAEVENIEVESSELDSLELESEEVEDTETEATEGESLVGQYTFQQITASEARELMETEESFILLDVRTQEEFEEEHIEGAILIPVDQIMILTPEQIPDKDILILVYCRSGRRSLDASQQLVDLGYTQVVEFGGIIDWPYEVVR